MLSRGTRVALYFVRNTQRVLIHQSTSLQQFARQLRQWLAVSINHCTISIFQKYIIYVDRGGERGEEKRGCCTMYRMDAGLRKSNNSIPLNIPAMWRSTLFTTIFFATATSYRSRGHSCRSRPRRRTVSKFLTENRCVSAIVAAGCDDRLYKSVTTRRTL